MLPLIFRATGESSSGDFFGSMFLKTDRSGTGISPCAKRSAFSGLCMCISIRSSISGALRTRSFDSVVRRLNGLASVLRVRFAGALLPPRPAALVQARADFGVFA